MNKFHFTYLFSIFCILCTVNCIAKSVCTTIPIAYSASNVKQRVAGWLPRYTCYAQPTAGRAQRVTGWLPRYTCYAQPMAGRAQRVTGWLPLYTCYAQPMAGWLPLFISNSQPMVGWLPLFIQNTLPDLGNMVHYTGAVPP